MKEEAVLGIPISTVGISSTLIPPNKYKLQKCGVSYCQVVLPNDLKYCGIHRCKACSDKNNRITDFCLNCIRDRKCYTTS